MLKLQEAWAQREPWAACGQRAGAAPPGPPHGHTTVEFPEQKNLSHSEKDRTTSTGKTQTSPRLGNWLP